MINWEEKINDFNELVGFNEDTFFLDESTNSCMYVYIISDKPKKIAEKFLTKLEQSEINQELKGKVLIKYLYERFNEFIVYFVNNRIIEEETEYNYRVIVTNKDGIFDKQIIAYFKGSEHARKQQYNNN